MGQSFEFLGDAEPVAQVDTYVVGGTVEAGDLFSLYANKKPATAAATTTNVNTTCSDIATAWNASTIAEHAEITAAAVGSGGALTLTGDTAGVPFELEPETTESNGGAADAQTFAISAQVTAEGPNVWCAENFNGLSTGRRSALPGAAANDKLYISDSDVDLLYNLDQSTVGNVLDLLCILASYTGKIGLPRKNVAGEYNEYRPRYLQIGATVYQIGYGDGAGSGRIMIDAGATATPTVRVYGSGTAADAGYHPIRFLGSNIGEFHVTGGKVDVAKDEGETTTISTAHVSGNGELRLGAGVTIGSLHIGGNAKVHLNWQASNITTIYLLDNATLYLEGGQSNAGTNRTLTNLYVRGGTAYLNCHGGVITSTFIGAKGVVDTSQGIHKMSASSTQVMTMTNATIDGGGKFIDPSKRISFSNGLIVNGDLDKVTLRLGPTFKIVATGYQS